MEQEYTIQYSTIDPNDIAQEIELLHLTGVPVNRRYVVLKLMGKRELLFSGDPPNAIPLVQKLDSTPEHVIMALVAWSSTQDPEIGYEILEFLRDPSDARLASVIRRLANRNLLSEDGRPVRSISNAVDSYAASKPRSFDDLRDFYAAVSPGTKRPDAAVRVWLQRRRAAGRLVETDRFGMTLYQYVMPVEPVDPNV